MTGPDFRAAMVALVDEAMETQRHSRESRSFPAVFLECFMRWDKAKRAPRMTLYDIGIPLRVLRLLQKNGLDSIEALCAMREIEINGARSRQRHRSIAQTKACHSRTEDA
jgi:hypothetical protein